MASNSGRTHLGNLESNTNIIKIEHLKLQYNIVVWYDYYLKGLSISMSKDYEKLVVSL